MYTFAIPDQASRYPIHFTAVPVNVKVARALELTASAALLPLLKLPVFAYQLPLNVTAELFCCTRVYVPVLLPVLPPALPPVEPPPLVVAPPPDA